MANLFEVNSKGWISQQRGREPYEVIKEALQNALDTESDIVVEIDYDSRNVMVKDFHEKGVVDLDELWTLFEGDKAGDPEQRGRFGRGIKELVGASDEVTITTTGGTVFFDVTEEERHVDGDKTTDVGTEVIAHNSEWESRQLDAVRRYIERFWVPEGIEMEIRVVRGGEESTQTLEHKPPDRIFRGRLTTVEADENGIMQDTRRTTDVNVMEHPEGGIYEMGIPVTTSEDFDYILDVQQKVPMAEQREEPQSGYRDELIQRFLSNCLDMLSFDELSEPWVMNNISSFRVSNGTQEEFITRRHPCNFTKGNVVPVGGPEDQAVSGIGYNVIETDNFSHSYSNMLKDHLPTSKEVFEDNQAKMVEQVDETDGQKDFINFITEEILPHVNTNLDVELVRMEEKSDTRATWDPSERKIYLNTENRTWEKINYENVGILLHELAHAEGGVNEHDMEFIHALQKLAGKITVEKSRSVF